MDIILVGQGGCMREIAWQMQEDNKKELKWNILGYVDQMQSDAQIWVGNQIIPYLGSDDYLLSNDKGANVTITVGDSHIREKIYKKICNNRKLCFPNIILGNTHICADVKMGQGCIISMDSKISTNGKLGDFVFLNIGVTLCHDANIEDFVTLSPYAKVAGNVHIGKMAQIGMGATVIQGMNIGEQTILGAGCVVVNDIECNCTAVGVPAKKIQEKT